MYFAKNSILVAYIAEGDTRCLSNIHSVWEVTYVFRKPGVYTYKSLISDRNTPLTTGDVQSVGCIVVRAVHTIVET